MSGGAARKVAYAELEGPYGLFNLYQIVMSDLVEIHTEYLLEAGIIPVTYEELEENSKFLKYLINKLEKRMKKKYDLEEPCEENSSCPFV